MVAVINGKVSAAATITGTPGVNNTLTATLPAGVIGTLQWTRTTKAVPPVKTLISGAVANAVNSLAYVQQQADGGCLIGCDASNQVSPSASVDVPPVGAYLYPRWRAALARVAGNTGYAKAMLLGDSTTAGALAAGAGTQPNRAQTPYVYLRDRLRVTQGLPVLATSWVGDQAYFKTNAISMYAYDSRFSQPDGAGYSASSSVLTVAGGTVVNTANANRLGFLAEEAVDTFDVYYALNTGLGTFNLTRVGSASTPVSQVGTSGTGKTTLVGALSSTDALYAARSSGGTYLIATDAYNSAVKSIRILQAGWSGGKVADWATAVTGFDPLPAAKAMACDLYLIRPGINDWATGTSLSAFRASLEALVDGLLTVGDVALLTPYPSNVSVASQAVQQSFVDVIKDVASVRGLKVDDTFAAFGTWVAANAAGYMADNLHPKEAGYQAAANTCATFMLTL